MSISTFQEKFIKGGCGRSILIFCGAAMFLSVGFMNCSKAQRLSATNLKGEKEKTFASVGSVDLPYSMVDEALDAQMKQSGIPAEYLTMLPLENRIQYSAAAIDQNVQAAGIYEIAKRNGFQSDEASVKKALHMTSEADFTGFILDAVKKSGELKADATMADLDTFLKPQLQGKTLKEIYEGRAKELDEGLKDPQKQIKFFLGGAQTYITEKFQVGINPSEDEIKKGFEKYDIKRIFVRSVTPSADAAAKSKIDKAYADLKAGKTFESVIDAYSDEMAQDPKKKKSESVLSLTQNQLEGAKDYKSALTLQEGTYTQVEQVAQGYAILKLNKKAIQLPPDYEAKKAGYKQQYVGMQGQKKLKTELEKVEKELTPKFEVKSFEAAYRFMKAVALPTGSAQDTELRAVHDLAKSVTSADDKPDLAAMVQLASIQKLYDNPASDKPKLKADRIAGLEKYLNFFDNWAYRKEVIDAYKEQKDPVKAFEQLMAALDKNQKFDEAAQSAFSDISAKFLEIKTAGLISTEQEKQFRDKQTLWQSDKKKYDEEVARQKKLKEEDEKKAAEEAKKAAAAAKNNKAAPSSSLAPPAPSKGPGN